MASQIPGYEYDVFISYRQNDNKYDGWVTDFVANLKKELDATIKEKTTVYFDANPQDGLLETHSVNRSLENKLKCLIFIPILSRTYCDPNSYAWNNEFLAFFKSAEADSFGLNVMLSNGNVAGRVLPVRIHDLDREDISLVESHIGVIRSIDFIYKSTGVNRPLRSNEDHPQDNLVRIYYRDQINKVANAIDEIIWALKKAYAVPPEERMQSDLLLPGLRIKEKIGKVAAYSLFHKKSVKLLILFLTAVLLAAGTFAVIKIIKNSKAGNDLNRYEKSIAVLPFVNDSPDQENTYFINGIMDEILNNLQKIKDFRVLSRTSTEHYRGTNIPTIPKIAKDLNVNYIVEGSGQKYGNKFRVRVQLISTRNEKHLWGESYEREITEASDIFNLQSQIARSIAQELKATITPDENKLLDKTPTASLAAYDLYQKGLEESRKYHFEGPGTESIGNAEQFYRLALKYDSTFALAYSGLADLYWKRIDAEQGKMADSALVLKLDTYLDSMFILANIALSYDNQLSEAYNVRGGYYFKKGNTNKTLEEWDKAIKYNPNDWSAYYNKGWLYNNYLCDLLKSIENYQKAASLNRGKGLNEILTRLGNLYYEAGFPGKGNDFFNEALSIDRDSIQYLGSLSVINVQTTGDINQSIANCSKILSMDPANRIALYSLGVCYLLTDHYKESLEYFRKYLLGLKREEQSKLYNPCYIGYSFLKNNFPKEAEYYL